MSIVITPNFNQKAATAPVSKPRIPTEMLDTIDNVLKVAAGCAMYYFNPVETIRGALAGAIVRFMLNDDSSPCNEKASRANLTASICFTGMATAYALGTPGTHIVIPAVLGFSASSDGAYNILRKLTN